VIQYEWWLLDMNLACIGTNSGTLGFLLAGVYGLAACMG
jgi:vacuolar-type H+-ATPase subunit F/Vma7